MRKILVTGVAGLFLSNQGVTLNDQECTWLREDKNWQP